MKTCSRRSEKERHTDTEKLEDEMRRKLFVRRVCVSFRVSVILGFVGDEIRFGI